jgi:hypothetical protein
MMINADIRGRTGIPEDVLTSCCLGLLQLLPDENLIEILSLSRHYNGQMPDFTRVDTCRELEFWPSLEGNFPDAIATLGSDLTGRKLKIVIEVKHGSGKSGNDEDQLVKYYNAATRQYKNHEVFVIYLTHHRDMPATELTESLSYLTETAHIYWLSWCTVARWSGEQLLTRKRSVAEFRILTTLNSYLVFKGYRRFDKLYTPPCNPIIAPFYTRNYLPIVPGFPACCSLVYKRTYIHAQNPLSIPSIYSH